MWMSESDPHPPSYYKKLFGWTKDNFAPIYRWALDFNLTNFDPEAPPPKTKHFRDMVDETTRPVDAYIKECAENDEWPMTCDIVNATDLAAAINTAPGFRGINPIALTQTLKRLGFTNLGAKRINNKKVKMWAVRNAKTWLSAGESDMSLSYEPPPVFDQRNIDY